MQTKGIQQQVQDHIQYLYLNSRDELLRLDVSKIVFFQANGNYTDIVSANKLKHTVCMSLSKVQQVIADNLADRAGRFARIGKSLIVNMVFINQINIPSQKLLLSDAYTFAFKISVSKDALRKLKDILTQSRTKTI